MNLLTAKKEKAMSTSTAAQSIQKVKEPQNLSPRITWLRNYYFRGNARAWNNEFTAWTTGTQWDVQFDELTFYIVLETSPLFDVSRQTAHVLFFLLPPTRKNWEP
jgi:hypothetical protein